MMSKDLENLPAVINLAETYGVTPYDLVGTFGMVAMPAKHSKAELVSCLIVANEHGLNPLTKEIYFMRTKSGQIQPIVGVDGWLRKCNEHPMFDGIEFEYQDNEKGEPVSATCVIYRKDRSRPARVTEFLDECLRVGGAVWKTSPRRMLRNRSITQCARIAFGFSGLMAPDEFDAWQGGGIKDVTPKSKPKASAPDLPPDLPEDEPTIEDAVELTIDDTSLDLGDDGDAIADPDGLLAHIEEDIALAGPDAAAVAEIAEQYADLIERLPATARSRAHKMLEAAGP